MNAIQKILTQLTGGNAALGLDFIAGSDLYFLQALQENTCVPFLDKNTDPRQSDGNNAMESNAVTGVRLAIELKQLACGHKRSLRYYEFFPHNTYCSRVLDYQDGSDELFRGIALRAGDGLDGHVGIVKTANAGLVDSRNDHFQAAAFGLKQHAR